MGKVLMIDNFDSFTYNLVQYFAEAGADVVTYRNDAGLSVVEKEKPDLIVISPGPGAPKNAGISNDIVREYAGKIPIFGVCLGMQVIAEQYGTPIKPIIKYVENGDANNAIVHGGASSIKHDGKTIFEGLPNPFNAGRYHSLGTLERIVASPLEVSAATPFKFTSGRTVYAYPSFNIKDRLVMGLRHKELPIEGVQFHPESVLTMEDDIGKKLIENVVNVYT